MARILENRPVYKTDVEGHGWVEEAEETGRGYVLDYLSGRIVRSDGVPGDKSIIDSDDPYLKVRVYNFEVEDFHTYYVVGGGVWVRGAECEA